MRENNSSVVKCEGELELDSSKSTSDRNLQDVQVIIWSNHWDYYILDFTRSTE